MQPMEKKRDAETIEEREMGIECKCNKRQKKINTETVEEREKRLARKNVEILEKQETHIENNHESELSESDKKLLNTFYKIIVKTRNEYCLTCEEHFLSIILYQGECQRCYKEKAPKKFSIENNMNPGDIPQELQNLTNIEDMLIVQVFPVVSVYNLCGGQYAYWGNVINFFQDIQSFITRLPHHPSLLNMLIINNPFYHNIDIDENILQLLPENGSIIEQFPQISNNDNLNDEKELHEDNETMKIINLQNKYQPPVIEWPNIEHIPIDKFNTPEYIACAFSALYPYGIADLHSPRIKKVQLAEYFQHLLKYKDALQCGQVYVKQNLEDGQLMAEEIQELLQSNTNITNHLESQGMVFFTFISADLQWPELHDLMPNSENPVDGESDKEAAKFLVPKWNLIDWWFCFEWQHRGSAHIHRIGIRGDALNAKLNKIKADENLMQDILQYIDTLITTINLDINAPIPNKHPCQKRMEYCKADLQDYVELVNKLQRHMRC
ncbi:6262_t:CDS:2, partial [Cetraspora pellucida]